MKGLNCKMDLTPMLQTGIEREIETGKLVLTII